MVEHLGNETLAYLETDLCEQTIVISLAADAVVRNGATMKIYVPVCLCHLFYEAGSAT